jgi:hypothetical protein
VQVRVSPLLLTALVAEARTMIEQARAEQAERAKVAAEEAEAAAAVQAAAEAEAAAERLRVEEEVAALTRRMQGDAAVQRERRERERERERESGRGNISHLLCAGWRACARRVWR